ncbi:Protein FAM53A [Pteropus alecto]|uniref:Protein FAM53A n=1 Tax=Pteropus alecto TaxID=9402 RepID=L5K5F7_PTEAL|nr:Protein FAM53A [Pteropus alecto]
MHSWLYKSCTDSNERKSRATGVLGDASTGGQSTSSEALVLLVACPPVRTEGTAPTMVTLITEKLQNQSLDDLARSSCDAGRYSAEKLSKSGCLFPLETHGPCGPSGGLGAVSSVDLRESSGPPLAPPTKRHCRSLSEPDELARCRSPWRPGGSKVWTPVSKRRCHSGGSATLQGGPGPSLLGSTESPGGAFPEASPTPPPAPRPASASSGFADGSRGGTGPPWCPAGPCALSSRRRLSLSQEHLADVGSPPCTPEPGRRLGLPRSRSQPCVLPGRRGRLKRRREGDARWPRPSLDFLKMTRTLKNSKSLCSLDYEDEDEDDTGVKTAVSSPRDPRGLTGLVTSGSSSLSTCPGPHPSSPGPWASGGPVAGEGGSSGDLSDWDSAGEEGVFPLDRSELDLEQIENN